MPLTFSYMGHPVQMKTGRTKPVCQLSMPIKPTNNCNFFSLSLPVELQVKQKTTH